MKIDGLIVQNFLTLKRVELAFGPVTIIAGDNWSGKSSLQQALRLICTGRVERVSRLSDYWAMVRDGAKEAELHASLEGGAIKLSATVTAKKSAQREQTMIPVCQDPSLFPLFDQHYFTSLDAKLRRDLIFSCGKVAADPKEIVRRLIEAGAEPAHVEEVTPLLLAGFDGPTKHIDMAISALRQEWERTSGEKYGDKKGVDWKLATDNDSLKEQRTLAGEIDKRREALVHAKDQENSQAFVLTNLRAVAFPAPETCLQCERRVAVIDEEAAEASEMLERQESALEMLKRATDNRERDVKAAYDAQAYLKNIELEAEAKTKKAAGFHADIQKWKKLAELVSWDGVPSQMIGTTLKEINKRLTRTSAVTGWPVVQLRDDMEVTVGNRLFGLLAESERWIADVALIEALAWVSGHKIITIDRMDILQPAKRGDLIAWLLEIATEGVQSIAFATLKKAPVMEGIRSYWLIDGEIAKGVV